MKAVFLRLRVMVSVCLSGFAMSMPATVAGEPAKPHAVAANAKTGAIDIPAFTFPPSSLSSEESQRAYARSLATPGDGTIAMKVSPQVVAMMRAHVNAQFDKVLPWVETRYPVDMTRETIAGVEVIRVRPKAGIAKRNRNRVLLNLHGGAFMVGWPSVALLDAIPVAALGGIEVITINYRMFPEATHPAALEDLTAVYKKVLATHKAKNVGIFGGSAGGVITLQSVGWLRKQGLPVPGAIASLTSGFQTAVGDS